MCLAGLVEAFGVPLVINDRLDVALACGAQGVHLGQSDMPVEHARQLLPPQVFIGLSVETLDDVRCSARQPVDYLGVSPVFPTPTKTDTATPWGLAGLRQLRGLTDLPLVAIGGIQLGNAREACALAPVAWQWSAPCVPPPIPRRGAVFPVHFE